MSKTEFDRRLQDNEILTVKQFADADWQGPLKNVSEVETAALSDFYGRAWRDAETSNDDASAKVFAILRDVCLIQLQSEDAHQPFRPRLMLGNGRSADALDYAGPQALVFEHLAPLAENPGLRARLADIGWWNRRTAKASAELAIQAYGDCVAGLLDGHWVTLTKLHAEISFEHVIALQRAIVISRMTTKAGGIPQYILGLLRRLYDISLRAQEFVVFTQLAGLALRAETQPASEIAADAERLAENTDKRGFELARKGLFAFAATAFQQAGDMEASRRCRLRSVDLTLTDARGGKMAMLKAHAFRQAIGELRAISGTRDQRRALERELRNAQLESLDDFTPSTHRSDLTDIAMPIIARFKDLSESDALMRFAQLSVPAKVSDLRKNALEQAIKFPLASLFGGTHVDRDGRVISDAPPDDLNGEHNETWYRSKIVEMLSARRGIVVNGMIHPARVTIVEQFALDERHLGAICAQSPFVAPGHADILAVGFTRMFQGEFISAAHLLLPQMEAGIRQLLKLNGESPDVIQANLLQEDRSLSAIFESMCPSVIKILGDDLATDIEALFLHRAGPALRHHAAHGKLFAAQCHGDDAVYGCWLVYQLTCWPLLDYWSEIVAPHVASHFG